MRTAVILLNLGGPLGRADVRPFLRNFFQDPNIIRLPLPLRWLLAEFIAATRSRGAAKTSYAHLNYISPLLENTQAQAAALQEQLGDDYTTHVCMRYWHPLADKVVEDVRRENPDRIILLPLYPQYSTTTTRSAVQAWQKAAKKIHLNLPTTVIESYPTAPGFIAASAELIKPRYEGLKMQTGQAPRLLFSAHGLPVSIIKAGDPYAEHCAQTAAAIVKKLAIRNLDWQLCYQSKVGPAKWLEPATAACIQAAAKTQTPLVIYPLAFPNEHVETLVELDIEYRHLAEHAGLKAYSRVPAVGTHPQFIAALADLVRTAR